MVAPLGLVAGNGILPLEYARVAKEQGRDVVAVAHFNETLPELSKDCVSIKWVHIGQIKKILKFFQRAGVQEVAFAGGIRRVPFTSLYRADSLALRVMLRSRSVRDDSLLRAISSLFEEHSFTVISPGKYLPHLIAKVGTYTSRCLTAQEQQDALLGWSVVKELGRLDIGQACAVAQGLIVAVEALEGTDAMIQRAGQLAKFGFTVVKRTKPEQDLRVDLPTIGPKTIETLKNFGATSLVIEAGKTFILEPEKVAALANAAGIAIEGFQ